MSSRMYLLRHICDTDDGDIDEVIAVSPEVDNLKARALVHLEDNHSSELVDNDWIEIDGTVRMDPTFKNGDDALVVYEITEVEEV